jgi:type II secretory pathway pseudopilin PulG
VVQGSQGFTLSDQAEPGPRQAFTWFGFTLAETLIILGIIGIVAALTMPSLIANYQKQQTVTQLKKMYTVLNQANRMVYLEHEQIDGVSTGFTKTQAAAHYEKYLFPYLKIAKLCTTDLNGCFPAEGYKFLNGNNSYLQKDSANLIIAAMLQDGSSIILWVNPGNAQMFHLDVNGLKGPNMFGKDVFLGTYTDNGFALSGSGIDRDVNLNGTENPGYCNPAFSSGSVGAFCGGLIMRDGWEIRDDYPW